jgi:putative transposase
LAKEATRPAGENVLQQQDKFDAFVDRFNRKRPHQGIDMQTPADLCRPSQRAYRGLPEIEDPLHDRTVTITTCGRNYFVKLKVNVSQVVAGQAVGIKEVADRIWLVSFMHYDIGFFDDETCRLEPVQNLFEVRNVLPMSRE